MAERIALTPALIARVGAIILEFPKTREEDAWIGVRWRVNGSTIAHLYGGEDQRYRVQFRGDPEEVVAFEQMGEPYFKAGWGSDVIGMIIDEESTDWDELAEMLAMSYCLMAPKKYADEVTRRLSSGG